MSEQERREYYNLAVARLNLGRCPNCDVKMIRGRTLKEKIVNRWNLHKSCPKCGFTVAGQ